VTRLLLWIGDLFERGVSREVEQGPFGMLCYRVSQWFYRLAWGRSK